MARINDNPINKKLIYLIHEPNTMLLHDVYNYLK